MTDSLTDAAQTAAWLAADHDRITDNANKAHDALIFLIQKSDALVSAIEGTTDQFESEVRELVSATSAAEKLLSALGVTVYGDEQ